MEPKQSGSGLPKSEFTLFHSIVHGEYRPHLPRFEDEKQIQKLREISGTEQVIDEDFINNFVLPEYVLKAHRIKSGDSVSIQIEGPDESNKVKLIVEKIEHPGVEDLIDLDFIPPEGAKAEYFCDLIQDEFYRIEHSAKAALEIAETDAELSFYAKRNVLIAKTLCIDAQLLSKQMGTVDRNGRDNPDIPNGYVMYLLKVYLIRSILMFQSLFKAYVNEPWDTEEDWRFELFDQMPYQFTRMYREPEKYLDECRAERGLPPVNKNPFKFRFDPIAFDHFVKRHPDKGFPKESFDHLKKSEIKEGPRVVPQQIRDQLQAIKDKEGGKILAARLGVSERTLYGVIGGKAGAATCRKIASADPQFAQLAELA